MKNTRSKIVSVALMCSLTFSGLCAIPAEVLAQQFVALTTAGDPGDGSEAGAVGDNTGDPTDGEGGDPTYGNGLGSPDEWLSIADCGSRTSGDPGDGEEIARGAAVGSLIKWMEIFMILRNWDAQVR